MRARTVGPAVIHGLRAALLYYCNKAFSGCNSQWERLSGALGKGAYNLSKGVINYASTLLWIKGLGNLYMEVGLRVRFTRPVGMPK